ncbi:stage III sporulation protein AD [Syntrophobotulus glycolicus DSM 8271]|uniref:Stage III sporulation protein AD n=1 Tax=Syntrophobotulus glycolicus (strain DSM 8271 / FlGlyR) TaxID=645991 RepID=F0T0S1_SYNGF|nr:stage III sporulation protein AD [Syntrophobotulus glycolicus]ADY56210.1 stage III sporulation protein AD [Syntrophobotulus glycolicus DSM 8271]
MDFTQLVGLALIVAILGTVIKQFRPEIAIQMSILAGILIFLFIMNKIELVAALMEKLAEQANVSSYYLFIVFKIVGIAYLAEFAGQICRDAGEASIATKVEIAAKVTVVIMAIPIIMAIIESISQLLV